MPNPLLPILLPPAHTTCYAAGTAPHRGPAQLPAHKAWAAVGGGTAAACRHLILTMHFKGLLCKWHQHAIINLQNMSRQPEQLPEPGHQVRPDSGANHAEIDLNQFPVKKHTSEGRCQILLIQT
eukprot:1146167-Pelagomonas_calceolata.AAC.2